MSGRYLLDTNAAIALLERDPSLLAAIGEDAVLHISTIGLGELYFGVAKSRRPAENREKLSALVRDRTVLLPDVETAVVYGAARYSLRRRGRPIPENDLWIAAIALRHELIVLTRDAHFYEVEGLDVESW